MSGIQSTVDSFNDGDLLRDIFNLGPDWDVSIGEYTRGSIGKFPDDPDETFLRLSHTTDIMEITPGKIRFDIRLRKDRSFVCPTCNGFYKRDGKVTRTLKHCPFNQCSTTVRIESTKLRCDRCRSFPTVQCPLVVGNHSFTKHLMVEILKESMDSTATAVSKKLLISDDVVTDCLNHVYDRCEKRMDLHDTKDLYMDEILFSRKDGYVTIVSNQDHRIVCITEGHNKESVVNVAKHLKEHNCEPENIEHVCSDMSPAYAAGIEDEFEKAKHILDRFHIMKHMNDTLNRLKNIDNRQLSDEDRKALGNMKKYILMSNGDNLSKRKLEGLAKIRVKCPKVTMAYDLKEEFRCIFELRTREEADAALEDWSLRGYDENVPKLMRTRIGCIMQYKEKILNWFDHRMSNGVAEGINSVLKNIKRAAYGYRSLRNFKAVCFLRLSDMPLVI